MSVNKLKDLALECMVKYIASDKWIFTDQEFNMFCEKIVHLLEDNQN